MGKLYAAMAVICALIVLTLVYALMPSGPKGMYCEGGVVNDFGEGACFRLSEQKPDNDPSTVASGTWMPGAAPDTESKGAGAVNYSVRRSTNGKYRLFRGGVDAGELELDGHWVYVRFTSAPGKTVSMRSDRPGVML